MNKLELRQLSKAFGQSPVLDRLSLEITEGEQVVVLGPSGCGKTTLLRLIAGLDLPDAGEVWIDGQLASRPGWAMAPHLRNLGMVFHRRRSGHT